MFLAKTVSVLVNHSLQARVLLFELTTEKFLCRMFSDITEDWKFCHFRKKQSIDENNCFHLRNDEIVLAVIQKSFED